MLFSTDRDILRSLGIHRAIEPKGSLLQPVWKLDNTPIVQPSETLVDVHALHIDSASFTQIASECDRNPERMKKHMLDIVAQRGKLHNLVTGSGGVLVGTVREIDEIYGKMHGVAIGDTIISLTSLSWLPLYLESIDAIYLGRSEVEVAGKAIFTLLKDLPSKCPSIIDVVSGYYHDGDV